MATSVLLLLSLFSLFSSSTSSHLHKLKFTTSQIPNSDSNSNSLSPTTYFEVTKPISLPQTSPCSLLLLNHSFSYTYNLPPVTTKYTPPSCLTHDPSNPPRIVLEWSATCQGRQFDRIFGIWIAGVELLRSCTAEPRATGIVWSVQKDVTKYNTLFYNESTLAVYLGNVVDSTYTGVYHVNLSIHFYFESKKRYKKNGSLPAFSLPADLILPISRNLPLNDGLWFQIQNSSDFQSKFLSIPSNTYRAVLEVYVSFHQDDEFWYTNPPNSYIYENNLDDTPGNGAFREVVVKLDGELVGVVYPFTVIYTGGVNPLLWRPITGIGSFNLPSYNLEITPFLGKILDEKMHEFGFGVTNALDVWFIDANLHLWLDHKSLKTKGGLISQKVRGLIKPSLVISKFKGLDGKFEITANRRISTSGWVKSSFGTITTYFSQDLHYNNFMTFSNNGTSQLVQQTIQSLYTIYAKTSHDLIYTDEINQSFPLYLYTGMTDKIDDTYSQMSNISFGFDQKQVIGGKVGLGLGFGFSSNLQNAQGEMKVKGNLVISGLGKTQEVYKYEGTDGCYFRNVSSNNYTVIFDISEDKCAKFGLNKWVPRRTYLAKHDFEKKKFGKCF